MFTCVTWATRCHKNGAPLDEVEKGAISKFYQCEQGNKNGAPLDEVAK